mgnify:CR=1 FL=1
MARRKTLPESLRAKLDLAERLAILRLELFGERGGPEMARRLGIPVRTWYNYEGGVTVPAEVVLKIIELTAVEPTWLLRGKGPKFRGVTGDERMDAQPTVMVGALLRTALQLLEGDASPELGTATARFLESERSLVDADPREAAPHQDEHDQHDQHDELRHDRGRREREWLEARREGRCLIVADSAMEPVLARGSTVAFAAEQESPRELDGRMVAAWVEEDEPVIRWFQDQGGHGLLRSQDSARRPVRVALDGPQAPRIRRILWIEAAR